MADTIPYSVAVHTIIASGQTKSAEILLRGLRLLAIQLPMAFTGTTLALEAAEEPGGAFSSVSFLSTLTITDFILTGVSPNKFIVVGSSILPVGFFGNCVAKIVSGSSEAASRDLTLYVGRI